jgi:hypothetical protein
MPDDLKHALSELVCFARTQLQTLDQDFSTQLFDHGDIALRRK